MWRQRFTDERLAGLYSRHRGQASMQDTPRMEARILEATRRSPGDGSTHWSTRKLAAQLGVSHMRVARVWAKHGIKPHRLDRYMASNDPNFETKAADIIGLYLNPPQHAAVFCVDEKTAIQALDRKDRPSRPLFQDLAFRLGHNQLRFGASHSHRILQAKVVTEDSRTHDLCLRFQTQDTSMAVLNKRYIIFKPLDSFNSTA